MSPGIETMRAVGLLLLLGSGCAGYPEKVSTDPLVDLGKSEMPPLVSDTGWLLMAYISGFDPTGNARWEEKFVSLANTGLTQPAPVNPDVTQPAIADDGYFVSGWYDTLAYTNHLIVSTASGGLWMKLDLPDGGAVRAGPSIGPDDSMVVVSSGGMVVAYTASGDERWAGTVPGQVLEKPSISAEGRTYILTRDWTGEPYTLWGFDADGDWMFAVDAGIPRGEVVIGTEGEVFLPTYPNSGSIEAVLRSFDPTTGETLWDATLGWVTAPVAIQKNGEVVVPTGGDEGGYLVGIDPDDGSETWRSDRYDGWLGAVMVGSNGRIYASGSASLPVFSSRGRLLQELDTGGEPVAGAPAAWNGYLVAPVGSEDYGDVLPHNYLWFLGDELYAEPSTWSRPMADSRCSGGAP